MEIYFRRCKNNFPLRGVSLCKLARKYDAFPPDFFSGSEKKSQHRSPQKKLFSLSAPPSPSPTQLLGPISHASFWAAATSHEIPQVFWFPPAHHPPTHRHGTPPPTDNSIPPLLHFLTPLLFYGNFLCSRRHTDSPDSVQENSLLSLFLLPPPIFQHFFGGAQKKNSGSNTCPPAPPKTRCNMSRGRILAKKRS